MQKNYFTIAALFLFINTIVSCNSSGDSGKATTDPEKTDTTAKTQMMVHNWISLFDGKSQAGWHGYNKPAGEMKNWTIEDSALVCLGAAKDAHGGDIVTDNDYENFELTWEWKVSKGANSGVMYHVIEGSKYQAPYETGPEYQVIDDVGFPSKIEEWQKAGSDYAMTTPNEKKKLMPVGKWNSSRIIFDKGHVEHWLNGEKIVEFQAWSDEWNKKRTEGKWKDYPDYGIAKKGKIALQDHGNKVYFRNIMIREL